MKSAMKTRSILSGLLIKLAIIFLLLMVASYLKLRLDFSRNKVYSLANASKEAVRSLKDNMVVKLYASAELPSEMSTMDRYLKDLLSEYQLVAKGKFHYELVRGLSLDEMRYQAEQYGLRTMQFRIYDNDKVTNKEVIYGLIFEYQGNTDALNVLPRTEAKLEYQLTQKIQKLSRHTLPEIGVVADSLYERMPKYAFDTALFANYNVVETDLFTPPKQTEVLIFPGTLDSLQMIQLYNLDQYLMKGGKLVVLQDKVVFDGKGIATVQSNIFKFFEHYGFAFTDAIVMDLFCDERQMGVDNTIPYPIYPVVRGANHPITRNISNIVMYMPNGVVALRKQGFTYETILSSSANSAMLEGPDYELNDKLFIQPDADLFSHSPVTLGAIVKGSVDSYFAEKPQYQMPGFVSRTEDLQMVVYGDRELYIDADKPIYQDRHFIILNAVDWLLGRNSMLQIRSRHLQRSILNISHYMSKRDLVWGDPQKIERNIKTGIKLVSIVLPSLLLIAVGGFMALRRKQLQGLSDEEK